MNLSFYLGRVDAHPVGHGGSGPKGPTRSAATLIPNHADGFASGPFFTGIKFFGELFKS